MFLTRMQINPERRGARKLLASPQALHAAVLAGYPNEQVSSDARVLWRVDNHSRHRVFLYIVSPDSPDLTHLVEQAGWPTTSAWDTKPYDGFLAQLTIGQHYQFRLCANPVRSGRRPNWSETKPMGHVTVKQQEQWLLDRADRLGFRVCASSVDKDEADLAVVDRSVRRFDRGSARVTIAMATFQGNLEVTDSAALRQSLTRGIGRAKAYGCGLLTLARSSGAGV